MVFIHNQSVIQKIENDFQIIDEVEIIKNNFKSNKVNYTYNDITFELYNHNGKYYFFHCSVYDKILKTKKNPYNNNYLSNNIISRIFLKKKLNDLIMFFKTKNDEYDINTLYSNFSNSSVYYTNKYIFEYITYFSNMKINIKFINDNLILQIMTNIGFDIKKCIFDINTAQAVIGYLCSLYFKI